MSSLHAGEASALVRPLQTGLDPASLYAALSDGGTRADTLLLERSNGASLLLDRAAIRLECRGPEVTVTALGQGGRNLLNVFAASFADRLLHASETQLRLRFPRKTGLHPR